MIVARRRAAAFSLVEVTLALGIAAFSLLAIFALLPVASQATRMATERTASTNILATIGADLRATASTAPSSPLFGISIPSNTATSTVTLYFSATGQASTSLQPTSRYRGTITFIPSSAGPNTATLATVRLTWPAAASVANSAGSVRTFVALARN